MRGFLHMPGPKLGLFGMATARAPGQAEVGTASFPATSTYSVPSPILSIQNLGEDPLSSSPPKGSWRKAFPWFKVMHSASRPLSTNTVPCCQPLTRLFCGHVPQHPSGSLQPWQGASRYVLPSNACLKSDPSLCRIHLQSLLS